MKYKIHILILLLTFTFNLEAQKQYRLTENYQYLSFQDFVSKTENIYAVKFFYNESWLHDIRIGNYPDCTTLSCILDNVFKGTSLHYLIEETGNIIITKYYAIKVSVTPAEEDNNFLPPTDYISSII